MVDFSEARGFIFDCDGTLIDSMAAWDHAEEMLFEAAGPISQAEEDEIHAAPIEVAAEILCTRYGAAESPQVILDHLDSFLTPYYRNDSEALPGAIEFVHAVRSANIPCVVVSSSPTSYLEDGLRHIGILDCFQALISTQETGLSKRETEIYALACEELGCSAEQVWAVDDAPYALVAMGEAGLNTIGVGNGCSAQRREEIESTADIYAETLEQLLKESKF